MTLLESLLDAIVRLEGDALVMHVGEKPYVVTTSSSMNAFRGPLAWGQVELSSRVLTSEAVLSMVGQILPDYQRQALDDLGAVEHEIRAPVGVNDRFTVVAARGGDDVWLELRRHPVPAAPVEAPAAAETPASVAEYGADNSADLGGVAVGLQESPAGTDDSQIREDRPSIDEPESPTVAEAAIADSTVEETTIEERVPVLDEVGSHAAEHVEHILIPVNGVESAENKEPALELVDPEVQHVPTDEEVDALLEASAAALLTGGIEERGDSDSISFVDLVEQEQAPAVEEPVETPEPDSDEVPVETPVWSPELTATGQPEPLQPPIEARAPEPFRPFSEPFSQPEPEAIVARAAGDDVHEQPRSTQPETQVDHSASLHKTREHLEAAHAGGVVVPLARAGAKQEKPASGGRVDDESLLQMLRVAADRGASTVYVVAQSRPMVRVDGEISALENGSILSASDIERHIAALAPRRPESPGDAPVEWISEVPEVGRVRCLTFRDHRGPGFIFRMIPAKSISADHLNLSPEIRELASLADGLVVVTGSRGSGKSTLLNSFVDLVNRSRSDHLVTIEPEIAFVHESRRSFVSQREVRHDPAAAAAAVQAAVREDPDVLVIDDLNSPEAITAALEAAESGRLVFASITAASSVAAIEALVDMFPTGQRASVRAQLSRALRGVVSQVLLRKAAGGRVTARELLLMSASVAASIRDGKASEVAVAIERGQRHGMVSMNDALAGLVRGGTVHSAEAYRRAPDRAALLACLARDGVDTSFAERLA